VTVAAFSDRLVAAMPPLRHDSRAVRLFRFLESLKPSGNKTDLVRAAQAFVRQPHRKGPVVVISDLYDIEGWSRGLDLLRFHGYEPRLVQIVDLADADATLLGDIEIVDAESQATVRATVTERTVRRYKELLAAFHASVGEYCRRKAVAHVIVACGTA